MPQGVFPKGNSGMFKKGHKSPTEGKHLLKATKTKISDSKKGKPAPWVIKRNKKMSGSNSPAWKGGKYIDGHGYLRILKPEHPLANKAGYVAKHTLVMEKHLGRFLTRKEVVHHINGDKQNNKIKNLKLFPSTSAHMKFHMTVPRYTLIQLKGTLDCLEKELTHDEYAGAFTLIESLEVKK